MQYIWLKNGVSDRGRMIPYDKDIYSYISSRNKDWYRSLFFFNDEHYKTFQTTHTVAGITDVTTNRLTFDFDSKDDLEKARQDAVAVCTRLIQHGIPEDKLQICFSGSKGFHVEVETDKVLTPEEHANINLALASDLVTGDKTIFNATRIFRVPQTRHPDTGLYKTPITFADLVHSPIDTIKDLSKTSEELLTKADLHWDIVALPEKVYSFRSSKKKKEEVRIVDPSLSTLDFKNKPKFLTNCKYALLQGYFKEGERDNCFTALAATFMGQGFPKEVLYGLLNGVAKRQASINNSEQYPEDVVKAKVEQVYSPSWKGGTFSCKHQHWLKDICERLGPHKCLDNTEDAVELVNLSDKFSKFALDLEQNKMITGIRPLDENVLISTSMLVGLLAAPSAGKTSTIFSMINTASKNNVNSMFFSMDMGLPLVYTRLVQKHLGLDKDKIFQAYKTNSPLAKQANEKLKEEYKNVRFSFKGGLSVEDMRQMILDTQTKNGQKIKMVAIDYLECIQGPYADSTANTAMVAQKLKDMANELEICVWLLLQTQKSSGDPSDPLLSMRNVKGASAIEQACSVIVSLYRPGFSPLRGGETDKFITVSTVKDRMGEVMSEDMRWDGLTSSISELRDGDEEFLEEIRKAKAAEKSEEF